MTPPPNRFVAKPPEKGSFPLDRQSYCTSVANEYLACLKSNDGIIESCRDLSKIYLQCRMDNNLMAKGDWKSLGFKSDENNE